MTNGMSPERWAEVEALLDAALDQPPESRASWLATASGDDPSLRAEVARLLEAHDDVSGPLHVTGERAAASWAAPLVAADAHATSGLDSNAPESLPPRIGPWQPRRIAGEGGMGIVYVADRVDGAFDMRVALKLVRRGLHRDDVFRRRFQDERQILARLTHPGIARVLDGGVTEDGLPFYVMEFVDGKPIDRYCSEHALTRDARLALMAHVCDAVADAHASRIVHRDLKPGNILVTAYGAPKLLDFGIAKLLADDEGATRRTALTQTGHRLLTPAYASPEQIRSGEITPATDVWALGVILYELLTGQHPFDRKGMTAFELERAILEGAVTPPSRVAGRDVRGDLDAIVLTALHAEPSRRYANAAELAGDLRRYLAGDAVHARRESRMSRSVRAIRRHRVAVAAAFVGMALGAVALVTFTRTRDDSSAVLNAQRESIAQRFYARGLAELAVGRYSEATRQFEAALDEDSMFAMAALYGAESASRNEHYDVARRLRDRARLAAEYASPRERLQINAYLAERSRLPSMHALADSLVTQFPDDPQAQLIAARAAFWRADYAEALQRYRRVAARDASPAPAGVPCDACEARLQTVNTLMWMDSLYAAERDAVRATEIEPASANAWRYLALAGLYNFRYDDEAYRKALELDPGAVDWSAEWLATRFIRQAEFARADEILRGHMATVPLDRRERSHWLLITSLRHQERFDEALTLAREFRRLGTTNPGAASEDAVHEAIILLERGAATASAALFDSMSRAPVTFDHAPVSSASLRSWHLAHAADSMRSMATRCNWRPSLTRCVALVRRVGSHAISACGITSTGCSKRRAEIMRRRCAVSNSPSLRPTSATHAPIWP